MALGDGLTREERETVIIFHEHGKTCEVTTASPVFARTLERVARTYGVELAYTGQGQCRAILPIKAVRMREFRPLSASERERRTAILRKARTP